MSDTYLLISDPPHGEVEPKHIAQEFGFTAAEALMRIRFPAPEIWFADDDLSGLKQKGAALYRAGAKVRIIRGSILALIPPPSTLQSFLLDDSQFAGHLESGVELSVPYSARLILVSCRIVGEGTGGSVETDLHAHRTAGANLGHQFGMSGQMAGSARYDALPHRGDAEHGTETEFADAYFVSEARVQRATMRWTTMDFSGLGDGIQTSEEGNREELLGRLKERFRETDIDERLTGAPAPKPFLVGARGLPAILGDIDPALKNLDTADLLSRLALASRL